MKELTIEEISELFITSGGSEAFMKKLNDRMNEPEPVVYYKELEYPEVGTQYWYIDTFIGVRTWDDNFTDITRFNSGNYYATNKEANSEFEWRALNTQILNSITLLNKKDNWVVDWTDGNQRKWYFVWDETDNELTFNCIFCGRTQENNKYLCGSARNKLRELYTDKQFKFWITKEKV